MRSAIALDLCDDGFVVQIGELVPVSAEVAAEFPEPIVQIILETDRDHLSLAMPAEALRLLAETLTKAVAERMLRVGQNAPGTDIPQ